jgi:hypothetical protein
MDFLYLVVLNLFVLFCLTKYFSLFYLVAVGVMYEYSLKQFTIFCGKKLLGNLGIGAFGVQFMDDPNLLLFMFLFCGAL